MRIISSLSTLALAAVAAAPALAQPVAGPFTGPRVEILGGYDNVQSGNDNSSDAAEGFTYGGALGYDFQLGHAVVGVEGEAAGSTGKLIGHDVGIPGDSLRLKADRDLYIGGRLGFTAGPKTLLYVKGGYTNFRVSSRYDDGTGNVFDRGVTLDGYRVGAGVEQKFSLLGPSGFLKAEYRYSHYSNLNIDNLDANIDTDRHQVLAGVGIRF